MNELESNIMAPAPRVSSPALGNSTHRECGVACRADFPFFAEQSSIAYLDSAATTQKPLAVLEAMAQFYRTTNANVHRGAYPIADEASRLFENARSSVAQFIGAQARDEIVFTKNATEALNVAAHGLSTTRLKAGDEVLVSIAEHHANFVPWQHYAARCGAKLVFIPVPLNGTINLADVRRLLSTRTKVVAITHCSNVLGVLNPIAEIAELAHRVGAQLVVDAAQSVAHIPVDLAELGCDVLAFSGHKLGGPTGIGVLYARKELLDEWPPLLFGGGMVDVVGQDSTSYAPPPHRFEAGTPPIAEAIGLAAAIQYLNALGMQNIAKHCEDLRALAAQVLSGVSGVTIIGPQTGGNAGGLISFVVDGVHNHDVAWFCGDRGVCLRAGSHCAHPLLKSLGYEGSLRASFYLYSTVEEVARLGATLHAALRSLRTQR